MLLKRPNVTTRYNFILELKYIKKGDANKTELSPEGIKEKRVEKVRREAKTQLQNYLQTDHAKRLTNLKAWLFILVGREWKVVEEMPVVVV